MIIHPLVESDENGTLGARACDYEILTQPPSLTVRFWVVITVNIIEGRQEA